MQPAIRTQPGKERQVLVCRGTGCESQKAKVIFSNLERELDKVGLSGSTGVKFTGCHGFCQQGPTVMIMPAGTFYCNVTPGDVAEIVGTDLVKGEQGRTVAFPGPQDQR